MNPRSIARRMQKEFALRFSRKAAHAAHKTPLISFTFDDFPRSALLCAGPLLEKYGVRATYYACLGLGGKESSVGRLFEFEDLRTLIESGHEIGCHTLTHLSAYRHSAKTIAQNCAENRKKAANLVPDCTLRNFSFPFGDVTLPLKRQLSSAYDSCRTIIPGINSDPVDIMFLRSNSLYSSTPVARIRALIDQNARENGWLVLYTHDVASSPSPFGCTPEYFREILAYAAASGATLLPVREALTGFTVVNSLRYTHRARVEWERKDA